MKRRREDVVEHRARTRGAAVALLEDMALMRDDLKSGLSRGRVRNLSHTLRRMLIEDCGLQDVASRRIGRVKVLAPDTKALIKLYEDDPPLFFASGGATLSGTTLGALAIHSTCPGPAAIRKIASATKNASEWIEMRVDDFLAQHALYSDGKWITRRNVIEHIVIYGHDAHSKTPGEKDSGVHKILAGMREIIIFDPNAFDLVLLEIAMSAKGVVDAPDVVELQVIIKRELSSLP